MPVSLDDAQKLTYVLAEDPAQTFDADWYCSMRSDLMLGRLLQQGVSPDDLGQASIYAPPISLYADRPQQRPMMRCEAWFKASMPPGFVAIHDGYMFRDSIRYRGRALDILYADGSPIRDPVSSAIIPYGQETGVEISFWDNHIAPTVRVMTEAGEQWLVIDPPVALRPLPLDKWKAKQGCCEAVILHAALDGILGLLPSNAVDAGASATIAAIARHYYIRSPYGYGAREVMMALKAVTDPDRLRVSSLFAPPRIQDDAGRPSLDMTVDYRVACLEPLRALQSWVATQPELRNAPRRPGSRLHTAQSHNLDSQSGRVLIDSAPQKFSPR